MIAPGSNNGPLQQIQYEKIDVGVGVPDNPNIIDQIKQKIKENKILYYYIEQNNICVFIEQDNKSYCITDVLEFKDIFEDVNILKVRIQTKRRLYLIKKTRYRCEKSYV